jgi:hypothetical protein
MRFLSIKPWAVPVAAAMCLLLLQGQAQAGNGKIAGTVTDDTGEALPGANVVTTVAGTKSGAITDEQGRYFILNVPPGIYTVESSFVGHKTVQITNVNVRLDLTSTVDVELPVQVIEGEVVTITADRLMVEKSLTTSRSTIGAAEINNTMPVSDLQELVNTTPSVFRGYIRGGRKAEAKVLVDGIDVSDSYFRAGEGAQTHNGYVDVNRSTGSEFSAVGINSSTVQALDIIAGTFNAEYDAASAGVINVVTKQGGEEISGRVFVRRGLTGFKNAGPEVYNAATGDTTDTGESVSYFDKYQAERAALLATGDAADAAKATDYYVFDPSDVDYGDNPATEMEVSVGGPLMLPRTNFYLTARYMDDQGVLPNAENKSMRYSLKLNHGLSESMNLTGNVMIDDGGELGGWVNRTFSGKYAYYPQGAIGNKKLGTMGYLGFNHVVSPSTFYEVKVSQVTRGSEYGYSDDNNDGIVEVGEDGDFIVINSAAESEKYLGVDGSGADADGGFTFFTTNPGNSTNFDLPFGNQQYRLGQPGFYYEDLQRDVLQLKGDITSQINYNHQIKSGVLLRRHSISKFMQRTQITVGYSNLPFEIADYSINPTEMAVYVQDKIEYGGVIVNAGIRLDGLDVDAQQIADFFHPSEEAQYAYSADEEHTYRRPIRGGDVDIKWFLQPRLGISHPISETAAMHYSWGKFYSPPSFSQLYEDYSSFTNPAWPTLYDVDADPTTATAYEMGLSYSFHPDYLLDVTAYYRDIENYGRQGFTISPADAGFANYTFNTTGGYADSRGFEIAIERRPVDRISGRINYAYSYIKASRSGNNSTPFPDRTSFTANSPADVADLEVILENREAFNTYEANVNGGGNPLVSGFDRTHRLGLTLMALLPADVEMSLISTAESGFHYSITATTDDPRVRETDTAPWNMRTDLRIGRGFQLAGQTVGAFLEVRNLLDRENILTYDNRNIPSRTIWEEDQKPDGDLNRAFTTQSQAIYDNPRMASLGFTVDF